MVILLIAFCICVCTLPIAHRLTTPQILLDMEDSEQEYIMQKKVNNPRSTPLSTKSEHPSTTSMTCKNCVSSAAIRQTDDNILKTLASEYNRVTDVLAEKYKSSRRSLGKAIKATDDLEIDYNMAEQYVALLNQEQQVHLKAG